MANEPKEHIPVVLVGFGGPERMEDVRPFIENVVKGRNVPAARVDAVVEQYRKIGGRSPYNELTRQQAAALKLALADSGVNTDVHLAMLNWHPYIKDTLNELSAARVKRAAAIIMAPHETEASHEKYMRAIGQAQNELGADSPQIEFTETWHKDPLFIEAIADRIGEQLEALRSRGEDDLSAVQVIFTAHSVPTEMSDRSGYAQQIKETAAAVMERLPAPKLDWAVGYQSRSGPPTQSWLEPDVSDLLRDAHKAGKRAAVVVPIGFLVDHVEVLFDLDVQAAAVAAELGMSMVRAGTVGSHPQFIRLLARIAKDKIASFYAKSERH